MTTPTNVNVANAIDDKLRPITDIDADARYVAIVAGMRADLAGLTGGVGTAPGNLIQGSRRSLRGFWKQRFDCTRP